MTIGSKAICAESADAGTHVTPFITIEAVGEVVEGVGDGALDAVMVAIFAVFVVRLYPIVLVPDVLVPDVELVLGCALSLSLAHAARWALRASSRECPMNFPPGAMQKSAECPGFRQ